MRGRERASIDPRQKPCWSGKAAMHRLWYLRGEAICLKIWLGLLRLTTTIVRSAVAITTAQGAAAGSGGRRGGAGGGAGGGGCRELVRRRSGAGSGSSIAGRTQWVSNVHAERALRQLQCRYRRARPAVPVLDRLIPRRRDDHVDLRHPEDVLDRCVMRGHLRVAARCKVPYLGSLVAAAREDSRTVGAPGGAEHGAVVRSRRLGHGLTTRGLYIPHSDLVVPRRDCQEVSRRTPSHTGDAVGRRVGHLDIARIRVRRRLLAEGGHRVGAHGARCAGG